MAESAEDRNLFWVDPEERGIFPLDGLIVSKSLAKTVRSERFEVRIDSDFDAVIEGCAAPAEGREKTWINRRIKTLYRQLFETGKVHTVECWAGGVLAGGLYGAGQRECACRAVKPSQRCPAARGDLARAGPSSSSPCLEE